MGGGVGERLCGLAGEASEGDLGGVEQVAGGFFADGINEQSLDDAGDEGADVIAAGERGHVVAVGFAAGFFGFVACDRFRTVDLGIGLLGLETRGAAAGEGGGGWVGWAGFGYGLGGWQVAHFSHLESLLIPVCACWA